MSRGRCALIAVVAWTSLSGALAVVPAGAATPDFSLSTLVCAPRNGFTTRPGDEVACRLTVMLTDGFAEGVTVDVAVPPTTTYDPVDIDNTTGTLDASTTPVRVRYGTTTFGFFAAAFPKTISMVYDITATAVPGDPIRPVATISTAADGVVATVLANPLIVTPPPASLTPSTLVCDDLDGELVRPGDVLACTLQLRNQALREDAETPLVTVPIPAGTAWAPGGNETSHSATQIVWGPGALPDGVRSGATTTPPLTFRLVVGEVPGGTKLVAYANALYSNAQSHALGSANVISDQLTVAPGAGVLTSSALTCADADGLPLYAGDLVRCTLTVADAAGRQDVDDVTATAPVPAATTLADAPTQPAATFAPASFGTIAAGDRRAVSYALRVDPSATPGTTIAATASVRARSTQTATRVGVDVAAPRLVVAARPVAASSAGGPSAAAAGAAATAGLKPGAGASRICASRRVVTVNVRPPTGRRWKSVRFAFATKSITGARAPGAQGRKGYFRARLVFQGLPKGPLKVAITGVTTRGRTVRSARSYLLCAKKA
jgi:hypothetical protein